MLVKRDLKGNETRSLEYFSEILSVETTSQLPSTDQYSDLDVVIYNKKNSVYNPNYFAPRFGDEIFTTAGGERLSIIDQILLGMDVSCN